jgi:hypothetical protein
MRRGVFPSRSRDTARDPPRVEAVALDSAECSARGGQTASAALPSFMTVVLLDAEHSGQADQRAVVGEDADDVGATADLLVEALERIGNRYEVR